MSGFVYLVQGYHKDVVLTSQASESSVYAVFGTMGEAVACLDEIYTDGILGVKHNREYTIIKRQVSVRDDANTWVNGKRYEGDEQ